MALSKAAKAALIAGGLYGLYKMLGKSQDGKDVPVEDRSLIRKTIADADKKEPVSSGRGKAAGAPAPSVKDKPTVKPASGETQSKAETARLYRAATPETPAAGAVKRASMAERKRGTAKQRARQDVMGTARLIDQGGRNAAAAASRAARKKDTGLARSGLAMGKAAREATTDDLALKALSLTPARGALPVYSAIRGTGALANPARAARLAAPTPRLTGPTSGARSMKDVAIDAANAKRAELDAARAARAATRQEKMAADNARRMGLDPTRRTIASDAVRKQLRERVGPTPDSFSLVGAKRGGSVKKSRDGMATKGKTKGRMC